ncbi:Asp23/Gls24 family envelope stress response protein [Aggregatilinea lenta]|uniref:Asp23/Gls24 family envelope stress response protein n=1 Tax=Aggregatilinea lenta TaxID=913108 RepID=UPI000E5A71E0|nr:Asp23/Gls24 family envelope stress response protein [Aggregatilinea lenta]
MVSPRHPNDTVTIAPGVLLTIARLASLEVPGVVRMGNTPGGVDRLFRRVPAANGVQLAIDNSTVTAHLYVVADATVNLRDMCLSIQKSVARSIREILGMKVESVNVHVEDVHFAHLEDKGDE